MGEIFEAAVSFFKEDDWSFTQLQDKPILKLGFQGERGQWSCYAQAREEQAQLLFYSVCPVKAAEDRRMALAEFLTRVNYGLFIGNFELDMDDGEIRYKTSIDVEGDRLSPALVRPLVYANVLMMDRYLPGIMSVLYGNAAPAEAIAKVEETAR
ncbi:MAG: YbjN domain-containing protein [Anaerolineae bacterium]|nr:YbjN domain-containing protein [Anaerolineae bacterium]